jgi:biotin transport system ATP-binding protein
MDEVLFSIQNLSHEFAGKFRALEDINLDIYQGQCLLIAGSNGSGKTVLMKIIAGLMEYSSGKLLYRGEDLRRAGPKLRRELGLIFQDADAQIVGETAAEDISFGPENLGLSKTEVQDRVDHALKALGLEEKRHSPPRRLSGGEKRRLAAAGILAMGCSTLIMDEPFANLDWPGVVQTLEIIRNFKTEGKTVIVLTHELEKVLALADRLLILHKGKIRDDGSPTDVLDRLDSEWGVRDPRRNYANAEDCSWL